MPAPTPGPEPVDAEIVPDTDVSPPAPDYNARGVPSFEHVRDKIEGRYATALGAEELAAETPQGRLLAEQEADRAKAAAAKLEEIRRSLGG